MNAFTDASRDSRLRLDVDGLAATLRAPEALHRLLMEGKPAVVSTGDFALKAMLDSIIGSLIVRGDYRAIQRLLGTLFGDVVSERTPEVPVGTTGVGRHPQRRSA
jgi:hypothetical protein